MEEQDSETDRLYVPLSRAGCAVALRLFRSRGGVRCAVGFTTRERLVDVLDARQEYYRLTVRSVRELARTRAVYVLVVDPGLVAAPVREHAWPVGALAVGAGKRPRTLGARNLRG